MDLRLHQKSVLVMAGSDGIGLAIAQGYHAEGAQVAIMARNAERLTRAASTIPGATAYQGDASKVEDIERVIAAIGGVDILVNNIGGPPAGVFEDLDDPAWDAAFQLTMMSAIRATRLVLQHMRARQWGRIINISSYGVKHPAPNLTLSNAIRLGALGWAKTLSNQVAKDNILVNTICPGWTETARTKSLMAANAGGEGQRRPHIIDQIPLGRMAQPEEIAGLAVFLGSVQASYITGTAIQVDGGIVQVPL